MEYNFEDKRSQSRKFLEDTDFSKVVCPSYSEYVEASERFFNDSDNKESNDVLRLVAYFDLRRNKKPINIPSLKSQFNISTKKYFMEKMENRGYVYQDVDDKGNLVWVKTEKCPKKLRYRNCELNESNQQFEASKYPWEEFEGIDDKIIIKPAINNKSVDTNNSCENKTL